MLRRPRLLASLLPLALLGCTPEVQPVLRSPDGAPSAAPPVAAGPLPEPLAPDTDPVPLALTVDGAKRICDDHLQAAQAFVDSIAALDGKPAAELTYEATLGRLDRAAFEVSDAAQLPYLMGQAHPDPAVREAAKACEPKTDKLTTSLFLNAKVAAVIRAYAQKNEPLEGERKRFLADTLRDFRRNGLELPPDKQARLRQLNDELTKTGQDFEANIAAAVNKIEVHPKQLKGLPADYIAKHKPKADGKIEITTDYPDYFPFVTYALDRKAALDLYIAFTNRGGDENVTLLERLLKLRQEKAKLLGYASWADYAIEPRMAKTSKAVRDFLLAVRDAVKEPAKVELAELLKAHKHAGGRETDKLPPPDRYYLQDKVRAEKYKFDSKAIQPYLEVRAVIKGLLDITSKMYGLEYKAVAANAWHGDVTAYEVFDAASKNKIGKFYLDLHPRADKYKHAAMFPIRSPAKLADGRRVLPVAALECNFPKPGAEPALMTHEDVVTFFHEFGHVLHHLLGASELATYGGTNTARDFVEAPSQMFEEWPWSREVLDLFAKHYQTGAKIPDDLFAAMTRARSFGRALDTQRQLFLATLDQELHSRPTGFDSTSVVEEVQNQNDSFKYVKGTHFQSSFGHLVSYDAGYYSYQWALALSRDVLTRFKKEGLLNPAVAKAWRDEVLSKGGGTDEREMVGRFLGRAPNNDAYFAYLRGKE